MKAVILGLMAALAGIAPVSIAQQAMAPAASVREACASDVQTLCAGAASPAERRQCLMANMDKASEGCRAAMGAAKAEAREFRQACGGDFRQFCASAQGPARMECLRQNQDKLSSGCQSALAAMPASHMK
jgi:hypothetical protein